MMHVLSIVYMISVYWWRALKAIKTIKNLVLFFEVGETALSTQNGGSSSALTIHPIVMKLCRVTLRYDKG